MRLLILGATGPTGRNLVDQALAAGHEVAAPARTASRLMVVHPRLAVVAGDATDATAFMLAQLATDEWRCRTAVISD